MNKKIVLIHSLQDNVKFYSPHHYSEDTIQKNLETNIFELQNSTFHFRPE